MDLDLDSDFYDTSLFKDEEEGMSSKIYNLEESYVSLKGKNLPHKGNAGQRRKEK
jgi:hypothetical protein